MIGDRLNNDAGEVHQSPVQNMNPHAVPRVDKPEAQHCSNDAPPHTTSRSAKSKIYVSAVVKRHNLRTARIKKPLSQIWQQMAPLSFEKDNGATTSHCSSSINRNVSIINGKIESELNLRSKSCLNLRLNANEPSLNKC